MPVLTICNHKGGTGKTTSAIHLAAALGRQGLRVLAVDFDPQGFMTHMMGAPSPAPAESSLALIDPTATVGAVPKRSMSDFDLIGATLTMTKAQRKLTRPTDVLWLRETLREGHDYDVVLIDTAAAVSVFTMNALVASDYVVIPVTPEYQPVVGAEQTWKTVELVREKLNPGLQHVRFLLTQVDARLNRHAAYARYVRERYADAVLGTAIRTSSSLAVASRDGRTVFDAREHSRGAVDYTASAAEIAADLLPNQVSSPPAPVVESAAEVPGTSVLQEVHFALGAQLPTAPSPGVSPRPDLSPDAWEAEDPFATMNS